MHPARLAVLHAQAGENLVGLLSCCEQLNRSAPHGTMVKRNFDSVLRQRGKALVGPFDGRHGQTREILDQSYRFKFVGCANTIQIYMDKRQASLIIFVNHDECGTGHRQWRCAKTLRDSANERRFAGSKRSVERDRFPPEKYAADRLA